MKEKLIKFVRQASKHPGLENLILKGMDILLRLNPNLWIPYSTHAYAYCLQFPLVVNQEIAKFLDQIPSETSPQERRFLYRFFSTVWSGENDIIEIGPFLGGTTRAIALGMCDNPRLSENSKLYTYDRFSSYYDIDTLTEYLMPLISIGVLNQSDLQRVGKSAEFMDIFTSIHANHDYYRRIVPNSQSLPDTPADLRNEKMLFQVPDNIVADAIFIDGCKSWFGTKYFMSEVCRAAKIGTYFIFQDYGWYTCFWIPAFVQMLNDYFEIVGYVNSTYVFVLTRHLNIDVIHSHYPDSPSDLDEEKIIEIFDCLIEQASARNDSFGVVRHTLQSAGALAYIGNKLKAKEIINALRKKNWAVEHNNIIAAALLSPTYSPEGPIFL